QQSTQAAGMYRDIDFLRTAVLSWRQSNGGDFTGLSTQELADAGLTPGRFNCVAMPDADEVGCATNPFGINWTLAVAADANQYVLTITPGSDAEASIAALASRYTADTEGVIGVVESTTAFTITLER
ncbi:MAG: hypothetical protein ACR2PW_05815, partial [Gammaproteobacteria bacterium]